MDARRSSIVVVATTLAFAFCLLVGAPTSAVAPLAAPGLPAGQDSAASGILPFLPPVATSGAPLPSAVGLAAALAPAMSAALVGTGSAVEVVDANTGTLLFESGGGTSNVPASTAKLLTAVAVSTAYGADQRIATRVVRGAAPSEVVLVGGGDPSLRLTSSPPGDGRGDNLTQLANRTAQAIKAANPPITQPIMLNFDDSLFTGPTTSPGWAPSYVQEGLVSRITALLVNDGFVAGISADPSLSATRKFAELLRLRGVKIVGNPNRVIAPHVAPEVAVGWSAPMSGLVKYTLDHSDNTEAEVLAHLAGAKLTGSGSFDGGVAATAQVLSGLGVPTEGLHLVDGSGLSRDDRVTAHALAILVSKIAQNSNPQLWAVAAGLPIAGFTGTLYDRFVGLQATAGRGVVRAKTGTLTGVSSLAGLTIDADGALLAFAFLAPHAASTDSAEVGWDRAAANLSGCGCK